MNFTAFAILVHLWSRATSSAPLSSVLAIAGSPADFSSALNALVGSNQIVLGSEADPIVTLTSSVTPDAIVAQASSLLSADEQDAIVQLMMSVGAVPTTDAFLDKTRAAGFEANDAARSALFGRLCAALRGKRGDDRLVSTASRSAELNSRLASAI